MNEQEFNNLVIPLCNILLRICQVILGDREEAKDALQEIYIKLWSNRDKLNSLRSIEAFARSVTRNHCLDLLRLKRKSIPIAEISSSLLDDENENEIIAAQRIDQVRLAMLQLNEIQKKFLPCVILREWNL